MEGEEVGEEGCCCRHGAAGKGAEARHWMQTPVQTQAGQCPLVERPCASATEPTRVLHGPVRRTAQKSDAWFELTVLKPTHMENSTGLMRLATNLLRRA